MTVWSENKLPQQSIINTEHEDQESTTKDGCIRTVGDYHCKIMQHCKMESATGEKNTSVGTHKLMHQIFCSMVKHQASCYSSNYGCLEGGSCF